MTKLKKPIVVTIDNIPSAVAITDLLNQPPHYYPQRVLRLAKYGASISKTPGDTVQKDIADQLAAQGINWSTWEPPQPVTLFGDDLEALPTGALKWRDSLISRPTLEAAYKLSTEAMQGVWPKWWSNERYLYRADSTDDLGTVYPPGANPFKAGVGGPMVEYAKANDFKPLTTIEAARILEGKR